MGLDMYAFSVDVEVARGGVTDVALGDNAEQISYWRKFNALHGWMEDLYRSKYGAKRPKAGKGAPAAAPGKKK